MSSYLSYPACSSLILILPLEHPAITASLVIRYLSTWCLSIKFLLISEEVLILFLTIIQGVIEFLRNKTY